MAEQNPNPLLDPSELIIDGKRFILSKFPAVQGREIIAKYPASNLPKIGDYAVSEEIMLKLMNFVGVELAQGNIQRLSTRGLIDSHCETWEVLAKIEMAMMEKNCSFFRNGTLSNFLGDVTKKILEKISEISIRSSEPSSQTAKQPSQNSEQSTV